MFLVTGIGNPEPEYSSTRHNFAKNALNHLIDETGEKEITEFKNHIRFKGIYRGNTIFLVKPLTYMNNSGAAVAEALNSLDPSPETILIHDDLSVNFGRIKIKKNGGAGGHRGVNSVIDFLGTKDFLRIKMGIGTETEIEDTIRFVLSDFSRREREFLPRIYERCKNLIEDILDKTVEFAMSKYNGLEPVEQTQN